MSQSGAQARSTYPPVLGLPGLRRARVVGVINVTPDSFSDGGRYADADAAVRHGLELLGEGADLLDIGGESTRPGAARVSAEEEWRRVAPVLRGLVAAGAVLSIDTMRASVAERALAAGVRIVNDVSGGLADPEMVRLIARSRAPYVLMHWRSHSQQMNRLATYDDVVAEVVAHLRARLDTVVAAGVDADQVVLDPGLGFAKNAEHNWALLARLDALLALGRPVQVGGSRKRFLGALLGTPDEPRPVHDRDDATAAISALAAGAGAWSVRVHAVRPSADAVRVAAAARDAR